MAQSSPFDGQSPTHPVCEPEDLSCAISIHPTTSHVRLKKPRAALALAFVKRHVAWVALSLGAGSAGVACYALLAGPTARIFNISLPWTIQWPIIIGIFLGGAALTYASQVKQKTHR